MSKIDFLKPELKKREMKELKKKLKLNSNYIQEKEAYKRKKELMPFI